MKKWKKLNKGKFKINKARILFSITFGKNVIITLN